MPPTQGAHLDADEYDAVLTLLFNLAVALEVAADYETHPVRVARLRSDAQDAKNQRNAMIRRHGGGPRAFGAI